MFPQNSYNEAPIPDEIELGGETFAITRRGKQICLLLAHFLCEDSVTPSSTFPGDRQVSGGGAAGDPGRAF